VSIIHRIPLEAMVGDSDDHRPASTWATVVDPGDVAGRVDGMAVVVERIAPGNRIPLHVHQVDEVIFPHGRGAFRLGGETHAVEDGSVVFIPAGAPHGLRNDGDGDLLLHAVFPTERIWIRYLERNPAPGTETDPVGRALIYDVRTGTVEPEPG
jgi:quercetin dioxygenase-like cupin family protein